MKKIPLLLPVLLLLQAGIFAAPANRIIPSGNSTPSPAMTGSTAKTASSMHFPAITTPVDNISERLLQAFKKTFPNAEQVQWQELADTYEVNFRESGILTKMEYDRDGNFLSSVRYYFENKLPVNILCRLNKRFPEKKVYGVTEMTTGSGVEYFVKLEDEKTWVTVKSDSDANLEVVEKYKKVRS